VSPFRRPTWKPFPPTSGRSVTKPGDSWDRSIGKSGRFQPEKFEDHYEAALVDLINKKRAGQPITKKDRPAGGNVVDLMEAQRRSVGGAEPAKASKASKKPRKTASARWKR
jgi:non-homologous end joining protein Ku